MVNQIQNLSKNSLSSLFVNVLNKVVEFVLYLVIAKYLGSVEFGKYIFIISLIKFLGLPLVVGYPYFLLRQASYTNSQRSNEYGFLLSKNIYVLFIYLSFLITSILLFKLFNKSFLPDIFSIFFLGTVITIPLLALNNSISAIIRSSGGEIKGQILGNLLPNIKFLIFIFLSISVYKFDNFLICLFCFVIASLSTLIFSLSQTKDLIFWAKFQIFHSMSQIINEIKKSISFVLIQIFVLANNLYPIICLGFFQAPEIVGNYKLAVQISSICGLFLHSINQITQPRFAKSYSLNDYYQIQNIALISNRLVSICSLIVSAFVFLFYEKFISIFFGVDFFISKFTFLIILLSPLINSLFGSSAEIVIMSGNEKLTLRWAGISLFIGILSNILLVPFMGINGVAISTLLATFVRGITLWKKCFVLLKVKSSFVLDQILKI